MSYIIVSDDMSVCSSWSMPVDVLKMDREFVRNIDRDEKDAQLVELILDIAKRLKVPVIAEGVETKTQFEMLKRYGCEFAQGFYFARPMPTEEFESSVFKNRNIISL